MRADQFDSMESAINSYSVDSWTNPCGHVDMYASVVREAL